jgi:hypothetical protein
MRGAFLLVTALGLGAGCASAGRIPQRTGLTAQEAATLGKAQDKEDGGFRRVWRHQALQGWRYIRWDEDRSRAAVEAPRVLLQNLRDELGRLNNHPGGGADLYLAVTVTKYRPAGLFADPTAELELVARDGDGRMMWAATGPVAGTPDLAESLADTPSTLIARAALRTMRSDLRPGNSAVQGSSPARK